MTAVFPSRQQTDGARERARPAGETSEARIAKALAHPLRARILQRLGERVLSPGDLAAEMDAPLGVVSYHVRMLRQYDCVELVRTEPRRGALQHFYRATAHPEFDEQQRRELPAALRGELAGETIDALLTDLDGAATAGTLREPAVVVIRMPLELDGRGLAKVNKVLEKAREQILAIAADSSERVEHGADPIPTTLAIQHFQRVG